MNNFKVGDRVTPNETVKYSSEHRGLIELIPGKEYIITSINGGFIRFFDDKEGIYYGSFILLSKRKKEIKLYGIAKFFEEIERNV